jgi:hypothetical protein
MTKRNALKVSGLVAASAVGLFLLVEVMAAWVAMQVVRAIEEDEA